MTSVQSGNEFPAEDQASPARHDRDPPSRAVILAALGVVYGDIGTSPLYAMRQSLLEYGTVDRVAVLGVLSLIAWALMLVVTVKYVLVIMRADNRGEGGVLAVMALAGRIADRSAGRRRALVLAGMVGVALFYGDAMITPAISVLSAVEGIKVATPAFDDFIVPLALVLLLGLFLVQSRGTARVGAWFGPVMVLWFTILAGLGAIQIARDPTILLALDPRHALDLFSAAPGLAFTLLGAVFLVVTGAETLYADMGHFGARPVRIAWLYFVLPALLLNYFGQGALLLADPTALENPFYRMTPDWALYPMVVLATMATIIASQAVISGAYSVSRQAVQLGFLPRLDVRHTSAEEIGQIYLPWVNYALLAAVVGLVLGFQSSASMGYAYGVAVSGTMAITTVLAFLVIQHVTGWPRLLIVPLFATFLAVDLAFLASNLLKFAYGGWFSVVIGLAITTLMWTWIRGREVLGTSRARDALPIAPFVEGLKPDRPIRVPGTAIYLTGRVDLVPGALLHSLKHYKVLHERVALLTVRTEEVPRVPDEKRLKILELGRNFYAITVRFGFMEQPSLPRVLALCRHEGLRFDLMATSFFVGRETLRPARHSLLRGWQRRLFILLSSTALDATAFFGIPANRAIEVGGHIEI